MKTSTTITRLQKALEIISTPDPKIKLYMALVGIRSKACGTAACLAGTLSLHPWFRKRGLRGTWKEEQETWFRTEPTAYLTINGEDNWIEPIAEVFGITREEAEALTKPEKGLLEGVDYKTDEYDENNHKVVGRRVVKSRLNKLIKRYKKIEAGKAE